VLVTGAAGFVGGHLVELLVRQGHQVRALARQTNDHSSVGKLDVEILRGDLLDVGAIRRAIGSAECIYHVAAKTTKHGLSRKEYYANNVTATKNLALAALEAGVGRFVYASSVGVYGTNRNLAVTDQTSPKPDSYYRETKLAGEIELHRLHQERGLPVVIARLGSVFGPRSFSFLDVCRKVGAGNFRIIGSGENHQQLIYVEDLVKGLQQCGDAKGIEGRTYVLPGREPATLKELLTVIAQRMNVRPHFEHLPLAPFWLYQKFATAVYRLVHRQLPRAHYYDLFLTDQIFKTTAAQNDFGYSPAISQKDGFHRLIDWYFEQGYIAR
jgi:nucleoside-diphosphate-sugar epimerase